MAQRSIVSRLADAGEEAIQRLGTAPGGDRLVGAAKDLRARVDEIQKRLSGLDLLEKRMDAAERRLDALEGGKSSSSGSSPARSSSSSSRSKKT
jgi:hypothetical protein